MRYRLLEFLCCPDCGGSLNLRNAEEHLHPAGDVAEGTFTACGSCHFAASEQHYAVGQSQQVNCGICWRTEVVSGQLHCAACHGSYAVRDGIPRMVQIADDDELAQVKKHTQQNFGWEWKFYARHGWDYGGQKTPLGDRFEVERMSFEHKAIADGEDLNGRLLLDAGCGNGRYSLQARVAGAEVIGADLGESVEVAYPNLSYYPDVHIIQADLFRMPLRQSFLDRIFSIGVLMHTGNALKAFKSLLTHLKPNGTISVHLYRKGNRIYEWVDDRLRRRTIHMNLDKLVKWSARGAALARLVYATRFITLGKPVLYQLMNCFIRLEFHEHNVFDWYSAPVASHHTYQEIRAAWCRDNNLRLTDTREREKNALVRALASPAGGVTFKAQLNPGPRRSDYQNTPVELTVNRQMVPDDHMAVYARTL